MKSKLTIQGLIVAAVIISGTWIYNAGAGDLEPASPPASTMHTLNDIYANTSKVVIPPEALAKPRGKAYLWIDTIPGESTDENRDDWIDIFGFSEGHSYPTDFHTGSTGDGRPDFQDIVIVKEVDKASPKLTEMVVKGEHLAEAKIEFTVFSPDSGERIENYFSVILKEVYCTSINRQMKFRGNDFVMMETITLNSKKIEWYYRKQRPDGTLEPPIDFKWNIEANAEY